MVEGISLIDLLADIQTFAQSGETTGEDGHIEMCEYQSQTDEGTEKVCVVRNRCIRISDRDLDHGTCYFHWDLDDGSDDRKGWHKFAELHFENCCFETGLMERYIELEGKVRFVKCVLGSGIRIRYKHSGFIELVECSGNNLRVSAVSGGVFSGNTFTMLWVGTRHEDSNLRFDGGNQIGDLEITSNSVVFFDLFEKVAESPECLYTSRGRLVSLRKKARDRNDPEQEMVLSAFISEISRAIARKGKLWSQERFVLWFRWILSDFNRSWIRPLSFLLAVHCVFCAFPYGWRGGEVRPHGRRGGEVRRKRGWN